MNTTRISLMLAILAIVAIAAITLVSLNQAKQIDALETQIAALDTPAETVSAEPVAATDVDDEGLTRIFEAVAERFASQDGAISDNASHIASNADDIAQIEAAARVAAVADLSPIGRRVTADDLIELERCMWDNFDSIRESIARGGPVYLANC